MSSSVSPASATAGEARVDGQREGIDHEPPPDRRPPDAAEDGSVLEALVGRAAGGGRDARSGRRGRPGRRPGRLEQGQPDVLVLLEADGDLLADADVGGVAPDDVRRQVHPGVLGQRHVGDDVGRIEVGKPAVRVHGEADDRARPDTGGRLRRPAPAVGADRHGRMDELAAVAAALDAQDAVGAGGPEPLVRRCQLGKRSHADRGDGGGGDESAAQRHGRAWPVLTSTSLSNTAGHVRRLDPGWLGVPGRAAARRRGFWEL